MMKSTRERDLELVEAAQAGDIRAFEALVNRYRSRLARYLFNMLRDSAEAEDIAQETVIRAYFGLKSFRGESSFSTWFYRIGINAAKNNLARKSKRLPQVSELPPVNKGSDNRQSAWEYLDDDTPETRLENKQFLDLLDHALDALPAEQRTALVLRELEGLSYEEIAVRMQSPVGTVRSRIHRARDLIAATIKAR